MGIYQKAEFDAAHRLLGYPGNCNNIHGHTWLVEVWIDRNDLDDLGMCVDYRVIKEYFKKEFDHRCILNDQDMALATDLRKHGLSVLTMSGNPTAENLARKILVDLGASKVRVHESAANYAEVAK